MDKKDPDAEPVRRRRQQQQHKQLHAAGVMVVSNEALMSLQMLWLQHTYHYLGIPSTFVPKFRGGNIPGRNIQRVKMSSSF